jgi:hypothetical protein
VLAIDDKLYVVESGEKKLVLSARVPQNSFWHATKHDDEIYIQEYGEGTGIYHSTNYTDWDLLVTNSQIDRGSRHFHYVHYDPYRNWLIVTLGDFFWTNKVKCCVYDQSGSWRTLYTGPWQFVPIASTRDRIIFGMDSGIVKGGIASYTPRGQWDFTFLRWLDARVTFAQMCDLRLLGDVWVASLGCPQAVIASRDLTNWYPVYVEGYRGDFNLYMTLSMDGDHVACATGRNLLVATNDELQRLVHTGSPIMREYPAHIDRLKVSPLLSPFYGYVIHRKMRQAGLIAQ